MTVVLDAVTLSLSGYLSLPSLLSLPLSVRAAEERRRHVDDF